MADLSWEQIVTEAYDLLKAKSCNDLYKERLDFEFKEIDKQGANSYWADIINSGKKFKTNPNHLLLPWLFDLVSIDPINSRSDAMLCTAKASVLKDYINKYGDIPSDIIKDQDMPDIDLDCLPEARDPIKEYAMERYGAGLNGDGYGPVCSVGTWQTYKFKSAIMDVSKALLAADQAEVYELTTKLPEDVDGLKDGGFSTCKGKVIDSKMNAEIDCGKSHNQVICPHCGSEDTDSPTIGKLLAEYENLAKFNKQYPKVIEYAVKLVGRIRNMGMHAGAIIIADRSLYGNIPLAKNSSKGYWITMWTEGRNTQLSKFGYSKWDILGLKTLEYIYKCSRLIEINRGITFGKPPEGYILGSGPLMDGWDEIDPTKSQAGFYYDGDGKKRVINLNDYHALNLANEQKTDAVFQFDTELAKCCRFDSNINTEQGPIEIQNLDPSKHNIFFVDNDNVIKSTKEYEVVFSGVKELFEVKLSNNTTLHLTEDHRVLTKRGYVRVADLRINDEILEIYDFKIHREGVKNT